MLNFETTACRPASRPFVRISTRCGPVAQAAHHTSGRWRRL